MEIGTVQVDRPVARMTFLHICSSDGNAVKFARIIKGLKKCGLLLKF